MSGDNFIKVNVNVGGKMQEIMMEKGVSFSNNGGEYCVFDNGTLKFKPTNGNVWQDVKQIEMKKYQWQVFQNVANNDGDENTYSQEDIYNAMDKYSNGKFTVDIQQDLPEGFKISKQKLDSSSDLVQVDVRMSENVGATLQFRNRGYMGDKVADEEKIASYKDVTLTMPDCYGEMQEYKGRGTVTTKDGLTTTNIYGFGEFSYDPTRLSLSVTKDANGKVVSTYELDYIGHGEECANLTYYTYDEAGRVTSRTQYNGDPELMLGDGTKVEHFVRTYDNTPISPDVDTYEYDERGNLLKFESISLGYNVSKEYTYHDNNTVATEKKVDDSGKTYEVHYDEQGREILNQQKDSKGKTLKDEKTIYHENGNVTKVYTDGASVTTDSRGNEIKRVAAYDGDTTTKTYDTNNNLTRLEEINYIGLDTDREYRVTVIDMKYDSNNRMIQRTKTYQGNVVFVEDNTYNSDGSIKTRVQRDANGVEINRAENGQLILRTDDGYKYEYKNGVCISSTIAEALKDEISGIPLLDPKREKLQDLCVDASYDNNIVSVLTSYSEISPNETLEQALTSEWIFKIAAKLPDGVDVNVELMKDLEYRIERLGLDISTEGKTPTQVAKEIAHADSQHVMNDIFK